MLTDTTLKRTACHTGGCTSIGPSFLSPRARVCGRGSTKLHLNLGVLSSGCSDRISLEYAVCKFTVLVLSSPF